MIRKINFLFISLILFFGLTNVVSANTVDFTKKGSIEVTLKENNNKVKGAEITLYHIADAKKDNYNLDFDLRSEINCSVNLDDLTDTNLVNEISKCNLENAIKYVSTTNEKGVAKFSNLTLGLYLVVQTKSVEGYSDIDSFLVQIPKVEDNTWVYNVKALPKTEIYEVIDLVIEKKWNSHREDIPSEVTIELYESDSLIDTIKLNEGNNWTYTFLNIKKSDKYSVKEINVPKGYKPSYKVDEFTFTVTNTDVLPFTGQIFYPIIIFSTLGIVLILTGIKVMKNEA